MSLRKTAPAFEQNETTANTQAEAMVETIVETTAQTQAANQAGTVVESSATLVDGSATVTNVVSIETAAAKPVATVTAKTAVAPVKSAPKYQAALQEFNNQIDPHGLDFDTFPRITVGLDGFSNESGDELGKKIVIQMLSYNERYVVSAGEDSDKGMEAARFSLDGITLDNSDILVTDYLKQLKETDGFKDASRRKYLNIFGFLASTSKDGAVVEIAAEDRALVSLQVPPKSFAKFTGYQVEAGIKIAQGHLEPTDMLLLTQLKVKGDKKDYAQIIFGRG